MRRKKLLVILVITMLLTSIVPTTVTVRAAKKTTCGCGVVNCTCGCKCTLKTCPCRQWMDHCKVKIGKVKKYVGKPIKPSITVYNYYGKKMKKGRDYTLTFKNNNKPGKAKVVIKGKGKYKKKVTKTFIIKDGRISITKALVTVEPVEYTGQELKPAVTVTYKSKILEENTDYTVSYSSDFQEDKTTVTITIKGKLKYKNSQKIIVIVNKKEENNEEDKKIDISAATVTLEYTTITYTGEEMKPKVTVTLNGNTLTEGTDYKVTYTDNVNVGTASVIVEGKDKYEGKIIKNFDIVSTETPYYPDPKPIPDDPEPEPEPVPDEKDDDDYSEEDIEENDTNNDGTDNNGNDDETPSIPDEDDEDTDNDGDDDETPSIPDEG